MADSLIPIPKFANEGQERAYWESPDSSTHLDWSKAQKAALPNLKPTAKIVQTPPVAFLIDADNLTGSAIDEAFEHLEQAGATVQIRRAYGGFEKLAGLKDVIRRHAIQAIVNLGKGTTDVALVVDAMDLLHRGALPSSVAIGSSDADFAPLAARLRESGLLVICFAQKLISSEALPLAYEKVVYVGAKSTEFEVKMPAPQALEQPAKVPQHPSTAPKIAEPTPVRIAASKEHSNAPRAGIGSPPLVENLNEVRRILVEFPDWLPDTIRQLNQLGAPLHTSGIKKGNKPLHDLFRRYPTYFKVLPTTGPAKQVRLLKKP